MFCALSLVSKSLQRRNILLLAVRLTLTIILPGHSDSICIDVIELLEIDKTSDFFFENDTYERSLLVESEDDDRSVSDHKM